MQLNSRLILGKPFQEKLTSLRKDLSEKKATAMIISMLDEVAWLFNLRGSDIDYNPVFFAYALVTPESSTLYINENKLTKEVFYPDSFRSIPGTFLYHPREYSYVDSPPPLMLYVDQMELTSRSRTIWGMK